MTADPNSTSYLLMEEYKLHRMEALHQMEAYNRQTTYIQTFGIILFTGAGLIYQSEGNSFLSNIPDAARVSVFVLGAALIFYFMSSVMQSSYSLLVLRSRMRKIEANLNSETNSSVFKYETEISPRFHGSAVIAGRMVAPVFWSALWRMTLFFGGVYALSIFSVSYLPRGAAIFYTANLFFFSVVLVVEYLRLFLFDGKSLISQAEDQVGVQEFSTAKLFGRYILNYFVVVFLFFAVFGSTSLISTPINEGVESSILFLDAMTREAQMTLVAAYVALCAIVLPTPSELPLILISTVGIIPVFVAAALGKSLGSAALTSLVRGYIGVNSSRADAFLSLFEDGAVGRWLNGHLGWAAYTLCQSVPFFPMRTSTIVYAAVTRRSPSAYLKIAFSSALGTIVRMFIMWQLINIGAAALPFAVGGL